MEERLTIKEWQKNYREKKFNDSSRETMINAGWYDWFCADIALFNRSRKMFGVVNKIKEGGKVNLNKSYVFFRNNCPCVGGLYDSFSICDIETRKVIYFISFNEPNKNHRINVYGFNGKENDFEKPVASFDSSKDLSYWLNHPWRDLFNMDLI